MPYYRVETETTLRHVYLVDAVDEAAAEQLVKDEPQKATLQSDDEIAHEVINVLRVT